MPSRALPPSSQWDELGHATHANPMPMGNTDNGVLVLLISRMLDEPAALACEAHALGVRHLKRGQPITPIEDKYNKRCVHPVLPHSALAPYAASMECRVRPYLKRALCAVPQVHPVHPRAHDQAPSAQPLLLFALGKATVDALLLSTRMLASLARGGQAACQAVQVGAIREAAPRTHVISAAVGRAG